MRQGMSELAWFINPYNSVLLCLHVICTTISHIALCCSVYPLLNSISLIGDAIDDCWDGLKVAVVCCSVVFIQRVALPGRAQNWRHRAKQHALSFPDSLVSSAVQWYVVNKRLWRHG